MHPFTDEETEAYPGSKAGEGLGLSHLRALSLSSPLTVSWGLKCLGAGDTLGKALR